jgi:hypothetical protein
MNTTRNEKSIETLIKVYSKTWEQLATYDKLGLKLQYTFNDQAIDTLNELLKISSKEQKVLISNLFYQILIPEELSGISR